MTGGQRYFDLHPPIPENPTPIEQVEIYTGGGGTGAGYFIMAFIAACLCVVGVVSLVKLGLGPANIARPAIVLPHQQAIEEARIQGFRAGYATATEQGCQQAVLSAPLPR